MGRAVILAAAVLAFQMGVEARQTPRFVRIDVPPGLARALVYRALEGAARRLADPECLEVLDDFQDPSGRTLRKNLEGLGKTAVAHLADLWFVEASDSKQCQTSGSAAFTTPGR